jgi:hypothetical protein
MNYNMELKDLDKYNINPAVVEEYIKKVRQQESIIVITGEFSSGKTCFVNAYLNKENFLPHTNGECTPVLIDMIKSTEQNLVVKYKSGEEKKVEASKENIEKYAKYTKKYDTGILAVSIPVESDSLDFNTHFIDSPGTNTIIKEHEEITKYILKKSDIVIYIFNRVIAQSDIVNIKEILKYTEDIIFIASHMDVEKASEYVYRDEADIERFIKEAKEQLKESLSIEEPEVYPIGSKASYKNEKYIKAVREAVRGYCEVNSLQVMRNRVKKQLKVIFEEKLKEIEQSSKLFLVAADLDKAEIEDKVRKFQDKIVNLSKLDEQRAAMLQVTAEDKKKKLSEEIQKLFKEEEEKISSRILSNKDITREIIEEEFSITNAALGKKLKDKLEGTMNALSLEIYSSLEEEVKGLVESVDIQLDSDIRRPALEELDDADHRAQIEEILSLQRQCFEQLNEVEQEVAVSEAEKEEIRRDIEAVKETISQYEAEMNKLGYYIPEYSEEVVEGGGGAGAKLGRFLGEAADIALIFVNPAGGAAKTADAVKDTAKSASIIQKGVKAAKSEPVKKAVDLKKAADKVKKVVNTVDGTRKKIKSYGEDLQEMPEAGSSVIDTIGKALDMLSLGYWGEKLGNSIGETIKPTSTILIEDEERKLEWETQQKEIKFYIDENLRKQRELEDSLRKADTVKQSLRLKKELQDRQTRYEELKEELEKNFQSQKERDFQEKLEEYYQSEIGSIFENEVKKAEYAVVSTFDKAVQRLISKGEMDLQKKLESLRQQTETLNTEKHNMEEEMKKNKHMFEELKNYEAWLEEWVI